MRRDGAPCEPEAPMKLLLGFTTAYTVGLLAYGLAVESQLTMVYTGITVLLFVVFGFLHRWADFPMPVLWGISLVGLGNMLGGVLLIDGRTLYIAGSVGPIPYDKLFHAVAAAAMVPVAWTALVRWTEIRHTGGAYILTFLTVMGGGAVVEIAELIGSAASNVSVGDYGNNALDLVANAVGAIVGLLLLWLWLRRERSPG